MWFGLSILLVPYWAGSADSLMTWREREDRMPLRFHATCNTVLPSVNVFPHDLGYLLKASCLDFFLRILSGIKQKLVVYQLHKDFWNSWFRSIFSVKQKGDLLPKAEGSLKKENSSLGAPKCRCITRKTNNGRVWYYIPVLVWFLYCLFFIFSPVCERTQQKASECKYIYIIRLRLGCVFIVVIV